MVTSSTTANSSISALSVFELASGLERKDFSAIEVADAYLSAIDQGTSLNAYIEVPQEHVRDAARAADQRRSAGEGGKLLGVPLAIKDLILTQGIRTTCASNMLATYMPPYDATVITRLLAEGAIVLGKANLDEFAMGSSNETSFFGPVRNPWDLDRVPGGTSGGSAAAVAASLSPASLGTDTGGSVRQPASFCGVLGLKPTYGRISRFGVVAYASSLDQVGIFTRDVTDCALLLETLAGADEKDATSSRTLVPNYVKQINDSKGNDLKGLRVGLPREYFIPGMNPEVSEIVHQAIQHLERLGADIVEISLPHTEAAVAVYYIIAPAEASSNLSRFDGVRYGHRTSEAGSLQELYQRSRSEGFGKEVKRRIMIGTYVLSSGYYDAYYRKAQQVRTLLAQDFKNAFADHCDVIATPVAPTTAFRLAEKTANPLEMYLSDIFTIPTSLAGLPAISIPCGFDSSSLPVGLQLIGNYFDESTLLRTAFAYEQDTSWHQQRPTPTWIGT